MSTPADIMEALGRHDAAATLRWGETPVSFLELTDERDAFADELDHATETLERLEAALCKRCADKWKKDQA
jgi:hypothetical protein